MKSQATRWLSLLMLSMGSSLGPGAIAQTPPPETAPLPSLADPTEAGVTEEELAEPPIPDRDRLEPLDVPAETLSDDVPEPQQPSVLPLNDSVAPLPTQSPVGPRLPRTPTVIDESLSSYIVGPGDQIGITVIGFDELERNRIVLPDGTILLPLVGPVVAAGQTLGDLETEITRRFSYYLVEPVVELNLNVLRPVVVTVGGEVNRPGPVQLNSLSTFSTRIAQNDQLTSEVTAPTLSTALIVAGGVRRNADIQDITVQRRLPDGRQTTFTVNLWASIFEGGEGDNILLQDGDVVFVPEASAATDINPQLVARSTIAPEEIRVRVIGEVERPGEVSLSPDSSVSSAIAVAGGHDPETADLSNVALIRLRDNGQVQEKTLDVAQLVDETPIQEGDVIVVPKRGYLNTIDNISRVLQPIATPFNLLLLLDRVFN